jgi:hypothetical protein
MNYSLSLNDYGEPELWFDPANGGQRTNIELDTARSLQESVAFAMLNDFYGDAVAQQFSTNYANRPEGILVGDLFDVSSLSDEIGLYDAYLDDVARLDELRLAVLNDPELDLIFVPSPWSSSFDQRINEPEIAASFSREPNDEPAAMFVPFETPGTTPIISADLPKGPSEPSLYPTDGLKPQAPDNPLLEPGFLIQPQSTDAYALYRLNVDAFDQSSDYEDLTPEDTFLSWPQVLHTISASNEFAPGVSNQLSEALDAPQKESMFVAERTLRDWVQGLRDPDHARSVGSTETAANVTSDRIDAITELALDQINPAVSAEMLGRAIATDDIDDLSPAIALDEQDYSFQFNSNDQEHELSFAFER